MIVIGGPKSRLFSVLPGLNETCYEDVYSTNEIIQPDNLGVGFLIFTIVILSRAVSRVDASCPDVKLMFS